MSFIFYANNFMIQTFGQSYVTKHWLGKLSLPQSYWINGVLLNRTFWFLEELLITKTANWSSSYKELLLPISLLVIIIVNIWIAVGIWQSATAYNKTAREKNKSTLWGTLAKIAGTIGITQSIALATSMI